MPNGGDPGRKNKLRRKESIHENNSQLSPTPFLHFSVMFVEVNLGMNSIDTYYFY